MRGSHEGKITPTEWARARPMGMGAERPIRRADKPYQLPDLTVLVLALGPPCRHVASLARPASATDGKASPGFMLARAAQQVLHAPCAAYCFLEAKSIRLIHAGAHTCYGNDLLGVFSLLRLSAYSRVPLQWHPRRCQALASLATLATTKYPPSRQPVLCAK
jgi:hypothetical protein